MPCGARLIFFVCGNVDMGGMIEVEGEGVGKISRDFCFQSVERTTLCLLEVGMESVVVISIQYIFNKNLL